MSNPFTLGFGKEPKVFISRLSERNKIIDDFESTSPSNQTYLITGVRGSGKTVLMSNISKHFKTREDWIVVNLQPNRPLLESLVAKLYAEEELAVLFYQAKLNLSLFGIGASFDKVPPITDIEVALEKMLNQVQRLGKRVLVTIDEVTKTDNLKTFTSTFQLLIREDLPIYLVMTGLFENIDLIQNDDTLTFLYRAPKIYLASLDKVSIKQDYEKLLEVSATKALELALLTKGYPYAFQTLGYLCWDNKDKLDSLEFILKEYDQYLREYVYIKIWKELSQKDREVILQLIEQPKIKVKDLREKLDFSSSLMSVYRERLKQKGLIDTSEFGYVSLTLPRFDVFVNEYGAVTME